LIAASLVSVTQRYRIEVGDDFHRFVEFPNEKEKRSKSQTFRESENVIKAKSGVELLSDFQRLGNFHIN
jgi:glycerate-2-kinase